MHHHLIGGREPVAIVIAEYDPAWPWRYESERARIAAALGRVARRIEHIGSTSVPELGAKPIVDILVVVDDPEDERSFRRPLEDAGYELRVKEPGHRMFRTPRRDVHVHLWPEGEEADAYLALRDHLRASAAARSAYESLKRQLSKREWADMNEYADAKGELIRSLLRQARARE
jgi:GrpB-like predicted nucleotidyltransferase (UPF0157 family)